MEGSPLDKLNPTQRKVFEKHPGAHRPVSAPPPTEAFALRSPWQEYYSGGKTDDELLEAVLGFTGDLEDQVELAVDHVVKHEPEPARKKYLRGELKRRARNRIRNARR